MSDRCVGPLLLLAMSACGGSALQSVVIPLEAVVGGPETMYPEYRKKLKDKYVPPPPVTGRGGGPPPQ